MLHRQQNRSLCYATEINVWIFCFAEPYALTFSQQFISISFFFCVWQFFTMWLTTRFQQFILLAVMASYEIGYVYGIGGIQWYVGC